MELNILTGCNSNYTIAAGGITNVQNNNLTLSTAVDAYNSSLTRTACTALTTAKYSSTAGFGMGCGRSCGNSTYAIIAGGVTGTSATSTTRSSTVEAYNTSLTKTTGTALTTAISDYGAENTGDYCVIIGGATSSAAVNTITTYDKALTKNSTDVDNMSTARANCPTTIFNDYLVIAGGISSPMNKNTLDADSASELKSLEVYEIG